MKRAAAPGGSGWCYVSIASATFLGKLDDLGNTYYYSHAFFFPASFGRKLDGLSNTCHYLSGSFLGVIEIIRCLTITCVLSNDNDQWNAN